MGMLWTIVVNLLMMGGMGLLYFMMQSFISTLTENGALLYQEFANEIPSYKQLPNISGAEVNMIHFL